MKTAIVAMLLLLAFFSAGAQSNSEISHASSGNSQAAPVSKCTNPYKIETISDDTAVGRPSYTERYITYDNDANELYRRLLGNWKAGKPTESESLINEGTYINITDLGTVLFKLNDKYGEQMGRWERSGNVLHFKLEARAGNENSPMTLKDVYVTLLSENENELTATISVDNLQTGGETYVFSK